MSTELWGLMVGVLSVLLAAGAVYFAWRSTRSGERSVELAEGSAKVSERALATSEEQLRLAREQAEMRPNLYINKMGLIPLHEATTIPFSKQDIVQRRQQYWGPDTPILPNKMLRIEFVNVGKTAAGEVRGSILLDPEFLKPTKILSGGNSERIEQRYEDGDHYRVWFSRSETLFNFGYDPFVCEIEVAVLATGTTNIKFDFRTPEGGSTATNEIRLDISDLDLQL